MHISLTPTLEAQVKSKVESGLFNNASEVIRDALRFQAEHEQLVYQMKLDYLRREVDKGVQELDRGEYGQHTFKSLKEKLHQEMMEEQTA